MRPGHGSERHSQSPDSKSAQFLHSGAVASTVPLMAVDGERYVPAFGRGPTSLQGPVPLGLQSQPYPAPYPPVGAFYPPSLGASFTSHSQLQYLARIRAQVEARAYAQAQAQAQAFALARASPLQAARRHVQGLPPQELMTMHPGMVMWRASAAPPSTQVWKAPQRSTAAAVRASQGTVTLASTAAPAPVVTWNDSMATGPPDSEPAQASRSFRARQGPEMVTGTVRVGATSPKAPRPNARNGNRPRGDRPSGDTTSKRGKAAASNSTGNESQPPQKLKGVSKSGSRWRTKVYHNGRCVNVGHFPDRTTAAVAYDVAARCLRGNTGCNFSDAELEALVTPAVTTKVAMALHAATVKARGFAREMEPSQRGFQRQRPSSKRSRDDADSDRSSRAPKRAARGRKAK